MTAACEGTDGHHLRRRPPWARRTFRARSGRTRTLLREARAGLVRADRCAARGARGNRVAGAIRRRTRIARAFGGLPRVPSYGLDGVKNAGGRCRRTSPDLTGSSLLGSRSRLDHRTARLLLLRYRGPDHRRYLGGRYRCGRLQLDCPREDSGRSAWRVRASAWPEACRRASWPTRSWRP